MKFCVQWLLPPVAAVVLFAGAAPPPPVDLVREASAAFAAEDFAAALALYERAEERVADPGLVAFNKGATLYRLGRFREAQLCYLRCLEDQEMPAARRARALYDLGTCLLHDGAAAKDPRPLKLAAQFFRGALNDEAGDAALRRRAGHNLELARLLWLEAKAAAPQNDPKDQGADKQPKKDKDERLDGKDEQPGDAQQQAGNPAGQKKTGLEKALADAKKAIEVEDQVAGKGNLRAVADADDLRPLDGNDAAALLEAAAQRILRDQLEQRRQQGRDRGKGAVKDW